MELATGLSWDASNAVINHFAYHPTIDAWILIDIASWDTHQADDDYLIRASCSSVRPSLNHEDYYHFFFPTKLNIHFRSPSLRSKRGILLTNRPDTRDPADTTLFSDGGYPSMNMASNCWAPNAAQQAAGATKLLDCVGDGFAQRIAMCQSRGKKVLLSLGGSVGNLYTASEDQAVQAAHTLWNLFLGGSDPALKPLRPYGDVVFDGIDIDNETPSNAIHLPTLASTLRHLFANDSSKPYYLSTAPQCPRPDASVPVPQLVNVIDFFNVQFYNKPSCQLSSTDQRFYASLQAWSGDLLGAGSGSNNFVQIDNGITSPRLLIGTPAFPAAGSGYVDVATYKSILTQVKAMALPNLAGAMFWDGAYQEVSGQTVDGRNVTFAQVVKSVLG
ncbi:hypothetical protein KCU88_g2689, partial [Aureobasidium melanogenum]